MNPIKTFISNLREDMPTVHLFTSTAERLAQQRIQVNKTNYIIRVKRFPSISYNGYEYVGQSNSFYIYRQQDIPCQ